jgi:hypothetical protein
MNNKILVLGIAEYGTSFSRIYEKENADLLYERLCQDANVEFEQIFIIDIDFNVEIYPRT